MQIGKRFFILGLLALFAFQTSLVIGNYFQSAAVKTPFGWQDEGYVLGPALKVYEEGWKSYRCRGDQIICYGAVHTFFDVLVLRILPESWVKESPLLQPSGPEWFYQAKYPNAFTALRVFRVALTVLLLGLVGWIASRSFRSYGVGALWALALPGFDAFRSSRMGLKNDFSFALYLIIFLLLANTALSSGVQKKTRLAFLLAIAVGVIGLSVKFGIILPLALLVPAYFISSLLRGSKASSLLGDLIFSGLVAGVAFFISNPAFFVNLGEANWFSSFLAATGRVPTSVERKKEFFKVLLPNLWPLPFLLVFAIRKWHREEIARWLYLLGVPIIWAFLTWKSAFHRPAYYLPILAWIFVVGVWTPNLKSAFKRATWFFIFCFLAFQTAMSIPSEKNTELHSVNEPWCRKGRCIADRTVRAAIPQEVGEANVLYFDSLSDSPRELERLIRMKWPEMGTEDPQVLMTCWQSPSTSPSDPAEHYSPAAEVWSKILKTKCPRSLPITANAAFAFENGWRPDVFSVLSLKELREEVARSGESDLPLKVSRDFLSPRMLTGSWQGIDSWYAPVILKSDAVLSGEFLFPEGLSEVILPFESTCKGSGEVVLEVSGNRLSRSADTRAALCAKRPWVCRAGLENWWTERFALKPILLRVSIPKQGRAQIRVSVKAGDPDRCRISLGAMHFSMGAE